MDCAVRSRVRSISWLPGAVVVVDDGAGIDVPLTGSIFFELLPQPTSTADPSDGGAADGQERAAAGHAQQRGLGRRLGHRVLGRRPA